MGCYIKWQSSTWRQTDGTANVWYWNKHTANCGMINTKSEQLMQFYDISVYIKFNLKTNQANILDIMKD